MEPIIKTEPMEFYSDDDPNFFPSSSFKILMETEVFTIKNENEDDFANMPADDFELKIEDFKPSIKQSEKVLKKRPVKNHYLSQSLQCQKRPIKNHYLSQSLQHQKRPTKNHLLEELFKDEINEFAVTTTATENVENYIKIEKIEEETDLLTPDISENNTFDKYEIRRVSNNDNNDIGNINQPRFDDDLANVKPYTDDIAIKTEINDVNNCVEEIENPKSKLPSKKSSTFPCLYCDRSFSQNFLFFEHLRHFHFRCHVCRIAFSCERYLKQHLKNCTSKKYEKSFKCFYCFKIFLDKDFLQAHINENHLKTKKDYYKCKICNNSCKNKEDLKEHINNVHQKPRDSALMCQYCGKFCASEYYLKVHLNTIHLKIAKKSFKCEVCQKSFSIKSALNAHMKLHKSQSHFPCKLCSKICMNLSDLKDHLKSSHSKQLEQSLICCFCFKVFSNKITLETHMNEFHPETGDQSLQCQICKRLCSSLDDLKIHIIMMHATFF